HPNGEPYKGEDYPIARALFSGEVIKDEEMIYRRGDGKLTILSVSATPIHDNAGKIIASVSTFSDIFEMKRAEAARERLLREANAARVEAETANTKLEVLLSVTDAALATLSLDDLLNELLSRLREILHTDTATILLVTPDKKSLKVCASRGLEEEVSEETIIPIGQGFAGQIAASRKPQVAENISEVEIVSHVMRAKGISSLLGVPLIVGEELIGVLHVGTFRIHHFSSYDVQLLELVADRAAIAIDRARLYEAARKAHKEAEEANRSKDAFIATVSHELRNPLNSILGYARLLREGKLPPSGINHAIEIIERSTKAQARLIEDLLDISRISSGRVRLDLQTVDFSSLVQSALDMVRPSATAKNIKLLLALDSNAAPVLGDPMRLQQVVSNLLVNAIKFTPPNGQVEISLNQKGSRLELAVSDTGKGISREFLPHVFEQFRQESGTQHTGGLGLGLSIVRHLVELHGGTVIAESQGLGKGATFVVRLPVKNIEEGKENVQAVLEEKGWLECQPSIEGVKILLVEDEPDTRELMTALLEDCLANVTAVASLSEAIEAIRGEKPDVLLSDIGLPDGDGYELVRRVRALMQDAEIPAAAVTAFA
ncbi:MAG TPA: ATP-binding protein, partial [Blastocatellia bacterium]|nr:ATP-binding protein [Blastocatellia bacterium]